MPMWLTVVTSVPGGSRNSKSAPEQLDFSTTATSVPIVVDHQDMPTLC